MPTPQTVAQEADWIDIGSAKIEVQAYGDDPDTDPWTDLGLADDIEINVERTFTDVQPGNGINPRPLITQEQATASFALWEQFADNLTLLDGGLSKTTTVTDTTTRTMGGGAEIGRVRMRFVKVTPRNDGTQDERTLTLFYGRLNGNESFSFKNRTEADPYNRKSIEMLFELDPAKTGDDREQLLEDVFVTGVTP